MTTTIQTTTKYRWPAKQANALIEREAAFVPTLVNLRWPVRKVIRAFQWRRQLSDLVAGLISGAASLR